MSLSIWHELDHPTHPIIDGGGVETAILEGARIGASWGQAYGGISYLDVMGMELRDEDRFKPTSDERDYFAGYAIGVRAGISELDVRTPDSAGFYMSGREMDALRNARPLGKRIHAEQDDRYPSSYPEILRAVVFRALQTGSLTTPERLTLAKPEDAAFIGMAIGLRYAQLSPPEGLQEREAA